MRRGIRALTHVVQSIGERHARGAAQAAEEPDIERGDGVAQHREIAALAHDGLRQRLYHAAVGAQQDLRGARGVGGTGIDQGMRGAGGMGIDQGMRGTEGVDRGMGTNRGMGTQPGMGTSRGMGTQPGMGNNRWGAANAANNRGGGGYGGYRGASGFHSAQRMSAPNYGNRGGGGMRGGGGGGRR